MKPMSRKAKRAARAVAGVLLVAMLGGAAVWRAVGKAKHPAAEKSPQETQTPASVTVQPAPQTEPDAPSAERSEPPRDPAENAGEVTVGMERLFPMERSENPRVVGSVEVSQETKEATP